MQTGTHAHTPLVFFRGTGTCPAAVPGKAHPSPLHLPSDSFQAKARVSVHIPAPKHSQANLWSPANVVPNYVCMELRSGNYSGNYFISSFSETKTRTPDNLSAALPGKVPPEKTNTIHCLTGQVAKLLS